MADKQDGILILHDKCEEQSDKKETYLMEYSLDGRAFKIGAKRKELWGIFTRANRGEPLILTTTTIERKDKNNPNKIDTITFVSEVTPVAKILNDRILESAINELLHRVLNQQDNERLRSQVISYSKDIRIAEKLSDDEMFEKAQKMFEFIKGDSYDRPEIYGTESE